MQNTNTGPSPYDLPAGKEYHIFIACSGEDSETGKWLLEQLESRYPMRCVYHERDFQPGVMIVENMRDSIDKCVKSLLLISNGFLHSNYCKLEETFAISLSNETGQNLIIPVLLEDVPLPNVLRHMTYVDARPHAQGDVVAKIREAYSRTAHQIRLAAQIHQIEGDDNGKRIGFINSSILSSCCSKQLKFDEIEINSVVVGHDTRQHIEEMCCATKDALKSIPALTFSDCFTMRRNCKGILIFPVLYCILVPGIYGIYVLVKEEQFDVTWLIPTTVVGTVLMVSVYYFFIFCKWGTRYNERKEIERTVWEILKQHYKISKCLIFYDTLPKYCRNSPVPRIHLIRYDTTPCKEFVLLYLQNKFPEQEVGRIRYELWADDLIECTIAYYSHDIIYWESLPKSSYNRHGIWKQRECICQLAEQHLSELTLGQCVWFTHLFKSEDKTFSNGTVSYGRTIVL